MMSISDSWYRDLTLVSVSTLTTMTSTISDPDNNNDDDEIRNIPCWTKQEQYYYQRLHRYNT